MKKIVLIVEMHSDKCRLKALRNAIVQGVYSVSSEEESRLVITGDVDIVCLVNKLRKKFRFASVLSVEDLAEEDSTKTENQETEPENASASGNCHHWQYPPPHCPIYDEVLYDSKPYFCSIM